MNIEGPDAELIEAVRERLERNWMPGDWFRLAPEVLRHYAWKAAVWRNVSKLRGDSCDIIEIGTRCGYSLHAFAAAEPRFSALCFDLGIDDDSPACLAHFASRKRGFPTVPRLIRVNTRHVDAIPPAFFAHVDGDHTRAGCLHDLGLVAGCDVILADDCDNQEVDAAVHDFLEQFPGRSARFIDDGLRRFAVIWWNTPE